MSHSSTLPSVAPEAKNFPLGEKASAWIGPCGSEKAKDRLSSCLCEFQANCFHMAVTTEIL